MIAIISSVPEEGKLFIKRLRKKSVIGRKTVYQGTINGKRMVYMISGMGKTNAAHAATVLIERFAPRLIVLFGVGGAYPSAGLKVGDIAVAEQEIYGDEGVLDGEGFHGTDFIGVPLFKARRKRYFNRYPLDRTLASRAVEVSKFSTRHSSLVTVVKSGAFVTLSTCTGTRKRALQVRRQFGAICENMEGASVAHICTIYGRPMVEIRGISNIVEDRDRGKWNFKLAAENCQKAVMEILKTVGRRQPTG